VCTEANKQEIDEADKIAKEYLRTDPSQRSVDIPLYKIKQGQEPPNFTGFFGPWDSSAGYQTQLDYHELKHELQSKNQAHLFHLALKDKLSSGSGTLNGKHNNGPASFEKYPKYTYDDLIKPAEELPEDVNAEAREVNFH
jgi:hypothetical protein